MNTAKFRNLHNCFISFLVTVFLLHSTLSMDANNGGGEIIRGLPCVKRLNQLFCGSSGNSYPSKAIDKFIDDNKALLKRMYGVLQEPRTVTTVRVVRTLKQETRFRRDVLEGTLDELIQEEQFEDRKSSAAGNETSSARVRRQADFPGNPSGGEKSGKEDVCKSKVEIVTPYWASNSNGKVRAILNNKEFEQAIHQEICSKATTPRCSRDCVCEQKYKWHRLLAYDPNNDCSGIFMDWFLFPSCCVCRCSKNPFLSE
eukprot:TRINITY_DN4766_c0_g1_i1.p1 TRINITY_DN4766_c0_g1~~TRINITY_DN4766_c0_g1_i1.p1  ORF type:complete len:257 (-),score=57.23 TRINITY_DN4766_c0_g1_i1:128-898(-)